MGATGPFSDLKPGRRSGRISAMFKASILRTKLQASRRLFTSGYGLYCVFGAVGFAVAVSRRQKSQLIFSREPSTSRCAC